MESHIKVGDVMTRNFIYITPETKLLQCARTMIKSSVGSLIIKQGDNLHGILTEKDIVWAITKKNKNFNKLLAKDIAQKKVISIKPEANITEALEKMNKNKIRRMPVISDKKIIGYVTLKDIVKFIPEIFQESREFEKIREETEKIKRSQLSEKRSSIEDPCEECGNYDFLTKIDGRMICESCKDEM